MPQRKHPSSLASKAKLTTAQVQEIRRRYVARCPKNGATALGRKYGVKPQAILRLVTGDTWRDKTSTTQGAQS